MSAIVKNKKIKKWVWPMSAIVKNKNNNKKNEYGLWVPYQKKIYLKNNNYKKKSLRPRCPIDQNAFRFQGTRPNMADAWRWQWFKQWPS